MARARQIVHHLTEADPDSPEDFGVQGYLLSPVARLASTNGFVRNDRNDNEERWVKKLSNGQEAWLRTQAISKWDEVPPVDPRNPTRHGGRDWEFVVYKPGNPPKYEQLARANEVTMNILLGALLQRLATWPKGLRKPKLSEARKRRAVPALPPEDEPSAVMPQYIGSKTPDVGPYLVLLRHMRDNGLYVSGQVTRRDHHYVHERTTSFEMEVVDIPPQFEAEIEAAASEAEKMISEEIVTINQKIYGALEREHDWLQSDEAVDDSITANDYHFDEEGEHEAGNLTFDQLSDEAKERAREWYREGNLDYDWWEHTYDEWKAELDEMGFDNVDISFSGFSSQGDGASFTGNHFDLQKWTEWFFSNKPTERGHPYTDDLFHDVKESVDPDVPSKEHMIRMGRAGECQELCPHCGAYCTLLHYDLRGQLMPRYHICQTCDLKTVEPGDTDGIERMHTPTMEAEDKELARIRKRVEKIKNEREAAEAVPLDDPEMVVKAEVARRSEPIKKLEIRGRRWFRRGAGGVYCKAYIYINDKLVHVTPEQYGYGDHYLTLAKDWLRRNGYLEGLLDDERDPIWYIRDKHGIDLQYGVTDVNRERDL